MEFLLLFYGDAVLEMRKGGALRKRHFQILKGEKMSLRRDCPCDLDGFCPYDTEYFSGCEYWCGADEPEDYPEEEDF